MQRVLDVLVAAAILLIPALAIAQTPASSSVAVASGHHLLAAVTIKPLSATSPGGPGLM